MTVVHAAPLHRLLKLLMIFLLAESDKQLTLNEMVAHSWVFFRAGFETSSSTMSFCLFELAKNQKIQRKVQKEIDDVTASHNNQITYESLSEMKYLDTCIDGKRILHIQLSILTDFKSFLYT